MFFYIRLIRHWPSSSTNSDFRIVRSHMLETHITDLLIFYIHSLEFNLQFLGSLFFWGRRLKFPFCLQNNKTHKKIESIKNTAQPVRNI